MINFAVGIVTVLLFVLVGFWLYTRRLNQAVFQVDFNSASWVRFYSQDATKHLNTLLVVNGLQIHNGSSRPITIDQVNFQFDYNDESISLLPDRIPIGLIENRQGEPVESLVLHNQIAKNNMIVTWYDFESQLSNKQPIAPGDSIQGNLVFRVTMPHEKVRKFKNKQLVVTDSAGESKMHTITESGAQCACGLKEVYLNDFVIFDEIPKQVNGSIVWDMEQSRVKQA